MAVTSEVLQQLSEIEMPAESYRQVLRLFANVQANEEARKAGQRERTRKSRAGNVTVTSEERDTDVTVTPQVAPRFAPKDNIQTPTPTPSETNEKRERQPHRMPRDFRLSEPDRQFARENGWTESEIDDGEAELVDYWANPKLPASKALKLDWSAVWRNRVRDLGKRRGNGRNVTTFPKRPNGQSHGNRDQHPAKADRRLAAMAGVLGISHDDELPSEDPGEHGSFGDAVPRGSGDCDRVRSIAGPGHEARAWGGRDEAPGRLSG